MPRAAFVVQIQTELCHLKWAQKVSELSRNRPQKTTLVQRFVCTKDNECSFASIPWRSVCKKAQHRLYFFLLLSGQILSSERKSACIPGECEIYKRAKEIYMFSRLTELKNFSAFSQDHWILFLRYRLREELKTSLLSRQPKMNYSFCRWNHDKDHLIRFV